MNKSPNQLPLHNEYASVSQQITGRPPPNLQRGVAAGIRSFLDEPIGPVIGGPPSPQVAAPVPPTVELANSVSTPFRRARRALLGALRPAALPFLHRLEWRVRTAVVKTGLVDSTARLENSLAAHEAKIDVVTTAIQELQKAQRAVEGRLEQLAAATNNLLPAIQAQEGRVGQLAAATTQNLTAVEQNLSAILQSREYSHAEFKELHAAFGYQALRRVVVPLGNEFLVRTPSGWLFAPASDSGLLVALYESGGILEPGTTAVVEGLLKPGDIVLDAGANIGLITLPAARHVGERGRVIAAEPAPEVADLFRRSIVLNGLGEVVVLHECAVGATAGRERFNITPISGHSSLLAVNGPSRQIDVDVQPLDALVPAGTAVALVKLDVEGSELPAWQGMRRIIAENPHLAVIVEFGPSHLARANVEIADWIAELTAPGFTPYEIDESTSVCHRLRSEGLDQVFSMNLLLLRDPPERHPGLRFA
jgi:FkbM family methyltransferase